VHVTAIQLYKVMEGDSITTGRRPTGVIGACVLLAARVHGVRLHRSDVLKVVKVADTTLRDRLAEFEATAASDFTAEMLNDQRLVASRAIADPPAFTRGQLQLAEFERAFVGNTEAMKLLEDGIPVEAVTETALATQGEIAALTETETKLLKESHILTNAQGRAILLSESALSKAVALGLLPASVFPPGSSKPPKFSESDIERLTLEMRRKLMMQQSWATKRTALLSALRESKRRGRKSRGGGAEEGDVELVFGAHSRVSGNLLDPDADVPEDLEDSEDDDGGVAPSSALQQLLRVATGPSARGSIRKIRTAIKGGGGKRSHRARQSRSSDDEEDDDDDDEEEEDAEEGSGSEEEEDEDSAAMYADIARELAESLNDAERIISSEEDLLRKMLMGAGEVSSPPILSTGTEPSKQLLEQANRDFEVEAADAELSDLSDEEHLMLSPAELAGRKQVWDALHHKDLMDVLRREQQRTEAPNGTRRRKRQREGEGEAGVEEEETGHVGREVRKATAPSRKIDYDQLRKAMEGDMDLSLADILPSAPPKPQERSAAQSTPAKRVRPAPSVTGSVVSSSRRSVGSDITRSSLKSRRRIPQQPGSQGQK
jgi:hypothetical protein